MIAQVKGKVVTFKKRPKNRQSTIRYEPYPTVVVKPNKSRQQKPLSGGLEDGEILDEEEGRTNKVEEANRSNHQCMQQAQLVTNMRQLTPINELCTSYCKNGTCTVICPRIHDPTKVRVCQSVLLKEPCQDFIRGRCRFNHSWDFHLAPSCLCYSTGYCSAFPCTYAHNDRVSFASLQCEQFRTCGYCAEGASCLNIHWLGELPAMIKQAKWAHEKRMKEVEAQRKLEEAKGKAKKALQTRPVKPAAFVEVKEKEKPSSRRSFGGQILAKEVEEVLGGAVKGELAMQQDFVPLN